jgi:hypothetical protein
MYLGTNKQNESPNGLVSASGLVSRSLFSRNWVRCELMLHPYSNIGNLIGVARLIQSMVCVMFSFKSISNPLATTNQILSSSLKILKKKMVELPRMTIFV